MRFLTQALLLAAFLASQVALAEPAQILIIRHGEEKNDASVHLSKKGKKRAKALVDFFLKDPAVTKYGPPVAIYASRQKREGGSNRAFETVEPLADALGLKVHDEFLAEDTKDLVKKILKKEKYDGKTVLICWPHDEIPEILENLEVKRSPSKWDDDRFDRVWKITFSGGDSHFDDIPQGVLSGDSN